MTTNQESEENERTASIQFHEMGLDDRILKAIAKLGWLEPSLIQEKSIPLFLDGKDVLIKARTGSGKTGAFAIPVIQKILTAKDMFPEDQRIRVLILAPTRELCTQIFKTMLQLTTKCSRDVKTVDISPQVDVSAQKPLLVDLPDVVVATPGRAIQHIKAGTLSLKDLKMLVVDEADLMFSCGYEIDVKEVIKHLPKIYQAALASATLSEDVVSLKKLVLHNAVTLKLQESELAPLKQLTHYKYYAEPVDKPAVLYTLLKLGLIRGKSIIFVNSVDKCYRLKLFLEQFKISSCILNSELPAGSRCHAVAQFNQGTYDIIIASDESFLDDPSTDSKRNKDKEFGVSRGIDFQFVSNIINYDFPSSINSYIHRAGRTARGSNQGTVLSFVSVLEVPYLEGVDDYLKESLGSKDGIFKLYTFKMDEMEGFRYRAKDAWKACTKALIREIRLKEIKQEVLNSQKLKISEKKMEDQDINDAQKEKRIFFSREDDMDMLGMVINENPFINVGKWKWIAEVLKEKRSKRFTHKNVRDRTNHLISLFRGGKDKKLQIASGKEEGYDGMDQLLQEASDLKKEFEDNPRLKKGSKRKLLQLGNDVREKAALLLINEQQYSEEGYFDENPKDLKTLRHDRKVKAPKTGNHLSNVPDYLVPTSLKSVSGLVKIKRPKRKFKPENAANKKYEAKRKNPLVSMDLSEFDEVMPKRKRKT